jgi:hypothetical protein
MKTVRFSKVVEKSGKPEVYLLLSKTDSVFNQALEANRIMTLSSTGHGSSPEFGTVGFDKNHHGQLLVFPKSLKSFAQSRIVGIKYDLFSETTEPAGDHRAASSKKDEPKKKEKAAKREKPKREETKAHRAPKPEAEISSEKIIAFPKARKAARPPDWKPLVQKAMRALEKGNSVAAYNFLKKPRAQN